MTPLSVSPLAAVLVIGSGADEDTLPLSGFSANFSADGPNTASCCLAVGWLGKLGGRVVERMSYERGLVARISVEVEDSYLINGASNGRAANNFTLFRGYVDDVGPSGVSAGQYTVDVRLNGRLNCLNTGTLQSSLYTAGEFADFTTPMPTAADIKGLIFDKAAVTADFGLGFLQGLYGMATNDDAASASVSAAQLVSIFGNRRNIEAARLLASLDSYVNWGPGLDVGIKTHIASLLERWNLTDFRYDSFYSRLQQIGQLLGFRLIETGEWLALVPYSPFAPSSACTAIRPDTYSAISRSVGDARQYCGVALASSRDAMTTVPYAGIYRRPSPSVGGFTNFFPTADTLTGRDPGQLLITDAPVYLRSNTPSALGGDNGLLECDSANLGFVTPEIREQLGDAVAREFLLSQNYRSRCYTIQSPYLRPDLSPLTPVKVTYPSMPGVPNQQAIFGSITGISVDVNSLQPSVSTTIRVGYARTALQQQREIDDTPYASRPHPLWSQSFTGLRLDALPNGSKHRVAPKSGW